MRPRFLVLCAASWLLLAAAQCACAQNGPLVSSGRPAPAALPTATPSSGVGLGTAPGMPGPYAPGSSLRDEPTRNDASWTRSSQEVVQAQFTSTEPLPTPPQRSAVANHAGASAAAATASEARTAGRATSEAATSNEPRQLKPPTAADASSQNQRSSGTVQMFISVVSSLLIVIGLLLGAAWCYRKASPNSTGGLPKQVVQVLGRTPLAPRQQLILVRFGPKLVLVSNLQGEVRTISEIDDPLEVDRVAGLCESSQAGSISDSFRTVLHNIGRTG